MKCIALQHLAFENLGCFENVLLEQGFSIEYRQAGLQTLSEDEWLNAALIVVLGGPLGVYQTADYPYLLEEISGIAHRLAAQKPTLGICLGAQLMAAALGAKVYPGKAKEIGWGSLQLSVAGQASALAPLAGVPFLHWHGDTFDLPQGALHLASTALTLNQAFSIGYYGLGLQFHPEVDGRQIETWLIGHTGELSEEDISIPALRAESQQKAELAVVAGRAMLRQWLAGALQGL
ncbi:glutamine amidotransferase [Iodobacter sp. CM08]|uniref:glutamine amidotransferase n=1 Tax=Iodobacter sp. CM08 TaxID=3085902 RepID=UPI002981423F|nr:glutamine amidotransferase [Iodobacter sp. CM08]MDW5415758.1 glutamine amidotransferase [Iodobacter sp. CM08]